MVDSRPMKKTLSDILKVIAAIVLIASAYHVITDIDAMVFAIGVKE